MTDLNRRRFLQVAGGTAAASMLSTSIARAAAIPASHRTGSLRDVEHIVVLMQENRSFDHYFGSLRGVRGFSDPRPVTLSSGKPVWYQSDGTKDVLPFRPRADNLGLQFIQDLDHSWTGSHAAFNQGRYDRWIPAKSATTMAYLTREDIPFHYALADTFTICDAYHCSLIGPTDPNRYYRPRRAACPPTATVTRTMCPRHRATRSARDGGFPRSGAFPARTTSRSTGRTASCGGSPEAAPASRSPPVRRGTAATWHWS
jgi:phospholipase C